MSIQDSFILVGLEALKATEAPQAVVHRVETCEGAVLATLPAPPTNGYVHSPFASCCACFQCSAILAL